MFYRIFTSSEHSGANANADTLKRIMKKFAIIIEQGENNLSAYVPDLPGCITTGVTVDEIERNVREAIELHLEGLRDGEPIPEPNTDRLRRFRGVG